jgi:hypothetical protein
MSGNHAGLPHVLPSGGETVTVAPRSGSPGDLTSRVSARTPAA